jgi:hypothetical protein
MSFLLPHYEIRYVLAEHGKAKNFIQKIGTPRVEEASGATSHLIRGKRR